MFLCAKSDHERRVPAVHGGGEDNLCDLCVPLCFYALRHTSGSGMKTYTHNPLTLPCVSWLSGRMCLGWTQQATFINLKAEVSRGEAAT